MTEQIFGYPIYLHKVSAHNHLKDVVLSAVEQMSFVKPFHDCEVEVGDKDGYTLDLGSQSSNSWFSIPEIEDVVKDGFYSFMNEIDVDIDRYIRYNNIKDLDYGRFWVNKYRPGSFQEAHTHDPRCQPTGDSLISWCYMVDLPENGGNFNFIDIRKPAPCIIDLMRDYSKKERPPTPSYHEEGNILFFPSSLYHFVTPNRSNETRITIAGNITAQRR